MIERTAPDVAPIAGRVWYMCKVCGGPPGDGDVCDQCAGEWEWAK